MESNTFDRSAAATDSRPCRRSARRWLGAGVVGALVVVGVVLPAAAAAQPDADGDGLYDWDEANVYGTGAYAFDTDGDGTGDGAEVYYGTDPLGGGGTGTADSDGDGLYDWDEGNVYGTNAGVYDSDGDGVGDGEEVYYGTDPLSGGWAGPPGGGGASPCVAPIQFGGAANPVVPVAPAGVECTSQVQQSAAASG